MRKPIQYVPESTPYDSAGFWVQFKKDLRNVKSHVTIMCPYVSEWRVAFLEEYFRPLCEKGILVCVILRLTRAMMLPEKARNEAQQAEVQQVELLRRRLVSWGFHVTLRKKVHQKIIVLDGQVLWEGSLNALSDIDSSNNMRRWNSIFEVKRMTELHDLKNCKTCQERRRKMTAGNSTPEEQIKQIGKIIREHREEQRLSQRQLGQSAGISFQRVGYIETAMRMKHLIPLLKLTNSLDLDVLLVPTHLTPSIMQFVDMNSVCPTLTRSS